MPVPLPDSAKIIVPSALSHELLAAASRLPVYDNQEYYDVELQTFVHDQIRRHCPDGFDSIVDQIKLRLAQRPYAALVEGLRFDEGNRLFVGINRAFGELVARPYEKPRAQLVHYIQPATDLPASRGSQFETEKLHTDTADWEPPVKLISMVCVRPDVAGGGRSRLLDVHTLRDEVRKRLGSETLQLLEAEPVPWPLATYRGGGLIWRPVIAESSICWRRYSIDLALTSNDLELSNKLMAALESFEEVVASAHGTLEFLMCEGDLLFADNNRTIHARTPISSGTNSDRLMIRSWIEVNPATNNSQTLTESKKTILDAT